MTISIHSKPTEIEEWYKFWRNEQLKKGHILDVPSEKLLTGWYARKVIEGEIIANEDVVLACKRHFKDLERIGLFSYHQSENGISSNGTNKRHNLWTFI